MMVFSMMDLVMLRFDLLVSVLSVNGVNLMRRERVSRF